jgi:hypothetical protein
MSDATGRRVCVKAVAFLLTIAGTAAGQYSGGTGEPNDPYQLATAADLIALGRTPADYDKHFILTADIDLDPNLPGGKIFDGPVIAWDNGASRSRPQDTVFRGFFNGAGHTVSNFRCISRGRHRAGLFGHTGGVIRALKLVAPEVNAVDERYVGALVGMNSGGTISACSVLGGSVTGGESTGGLIGYNVGTVADCSAASGVCGDCAGGLVGYNMNGEVSRCYATGSVWGFSAVGGLVGQNGGWLSGWGERWPLQGTIHNCYARGDVNGDAAVGGLVGLNEVGVVAQCYCSGGVSGDERVGGVVGENHATVTSCFWDTETSGLSESAGGTGRTTAELQTMQTFLDAGWDFVGETANGTEDIWWIEEGKDYPRLWWEAPSE